MAEAGDLQIIFYIKLEAEKIESSYVSTYLKVARGEASQKYRLALWRRMCKREPCSRSSWCSCRSLRPPCQGWCSLGWLPRAGVSTRTWRASSTVLIEILAAWCRQRQLLQQFPHPRSTSRKSRCGSTCLELEPSLPVAAVGFPCLLPARSSCPSACTSSKSPLPLPLSWNPRPSSTSSRSWR